MYHSWGVSPWHPARAKAWALCAPTFAVLTGSHGPAGTACSHCDEALHGDLSMAQETAHLPTEENGVGKESYANVLCCSPSPVQYLLLELPPCLHSAFCSSLCPDSSALVHSPQSSSLLTSLSISLMFGNPPRLLVPLPLRQQSTLLFKHLIHAVDHISERQRW